MRTAWCSAYAAHGCVLNVRCCSDACYLPGRRVRLIFIMELVSRILRGCAYGTAFGVCSPSGTPLHMFAFMHVCTAVGRCSPSRVPVVVIMCVYACTAFGMYGPSGVLFVQKCVCVCLHSARRVPSGRCTYCVSCAVYPLHASGETCAPHMHVYSVRHGPPEQCTYCT